MNDRGKIKLAMERPDDWVLRIVYVDENGRKTRRIVSPIRYGRHRGVSGYAAFQALCLARQEPRWFKVFGCHNVELVRASEVLMPTEIEELS